VDPRTDLNKNELGGAVRSLLLVAGGGRLTLGVFFLESCDKKEPVGDTTGVDLSFPALDSPPHTSHHPNPLLHSAPSGVKWRSLPTQPKLFVEVERLHNRGQALLRREGCEAEAIAFVRQGTLG
jgi:hypothetical protein